MAILVTAVALSIGGQTAIAVARDAYTKAYGEYRSAQDDFAAADADATSTVASTAPESLADPLALSTLRSLQASPSTVKPIALVEIGQMGDIGQIDELRRAVEVAASQLRHNTEALTQAVDDVAASVLLKSVSDAEISLDSTISEAESVLADSEGRVPDDAVRVELASRVAAARALRDSGSNDLPALQSAITGLVEQRDAVLSVRKAIWADVNGTWCYWKNATLCATISLPDADQGTRKLVVGGPFESIGSFSPCFVGSIGEPTSSNGNALLVFCPRGVTASGSQPEFDNDNFDRIFITQSAEVSPWFRKDERAAATQ